MPSSSVRVSPSVQSCALATRPPYVVTWNRVSIATSLFMLLNITLMPLKAYISEAFPWQGARAPVAAWDTTSAYDIAYLNLTLDLVSSTGLANRPAFYRNVTLRTDVFRTLLDMRDMAPVTDCLSFLYSKPGVLFYAPSYQDVLCAFAAADHRNASDAMRWHKRGACQCVTLLSFVVAQGCVWLTSGDDIASSAPTTSVFTLTFTVQLPKFHYWLWFKFVYRVGLIGFVVWMSYSRYYRFCGELRHIVKHHGHMVPRPSRDWSFEIVMGDPTSIVLRDPVVCTLFSIDVWLSIEYVGIAAIRATQISDVYYLFIAFLYFSRTVWFAYLALCLVGKVLKKWRKEHCFIEVDKTLMAMGVTFFAIPLLYVQANTPLVGLYFWLFRVLAMTDPEHQQEVALGCIAISIMIGSIPLVYGFGRRRSRTSTDAHHVSSALLPLPSGVVQPARRATSYASQLYNGFKERTLFRLVRCFVPEHGDVVESGGSIYEAFAANPRYKQYPTLGQRGVDCFLVCKKDGAATHVVRLSLGSCLDRQLEDASIAITDDTTADDPVAVFHSIMPVSGAGTRRFQLQRGFTDSAWFM
ncbi:hypothetical protein SDRG_01931 [Saprolegnia diclina VS20]|uniref:Uncharacterized protein n=1 Tax=Saprolegnia diclina (strain VS20) TaxID=1156394 RepID=T0R3D6_SAPDV|nr:hypothetical protein SDRG_01931 [Saprolegnia diclina VS20]EQC40865.1 hypothetical protein SDRG_01931 [Saprolegnia diclina VS20]|eukprot:XP_008605709.1 hypothetical protein SDRG_01931 [Saprolegnia diclina VS20]